MQVAAGAKFWKALLTQGAKEAFEQDRMHAQTMYQAASSAGSSGVTPSAGTSEAGTPVMLIVDDEPGCGDQSKQTLKAPVRKAQESAKRKKPPSKRQRKTSKETGPAGADSKETGADSKEPGAESKETGPASADSQKKGAESKETGAESKETGALGADSKETGADSKETGAGSKETGAAGADLEGDQQEANKVMCHHCGGLFLERSCRLRSKTPPKWQCNRCNCKLVHLNRLCKTWPPKEFAGLSIQEQQEFFRQTAGLSGEDTKAALLNTLSRNLISRKKEADSGRFLPLAWYAKEGFDTKMIEETASDQDKMWHPRFGWAYKVDIREHSWEQVEETVRQELTETLFRRGTADKPAARGSKPKPDSDSDEGSSDAEGAKAQALKAFLKERKEKEKEQQAEEEKRLKEAVAETKVLAGKMVRKLPPVLDKLKTLKENALFSDVPGVVTKKVEHSQTELEHFLKHAQSRKETPAKGLKFSIEEVDEGIARANAVITSLRRFYATLAKV